MVFPKRGKRFLLQIFILVIISRPFVAVAFVPSNECNRFDHGPCSSTRSRPVNSAQRRQQQIHSGATAPTTVTTLHGIPEVLAGVASVAVGFAGWLYIDGADARDRNRMREEQDAIIKANQEERARLAYIEPKEYWTEEELAPYDGSRDEDGPILLAADGLVFNVYKGRNFYLPG